MGHKARVYIGSSNISLTFWGRLRDLLGSTSPVDTGSSVQEMNFIWGLAFHAFRGRIYSVWDQGGGGMRDGLLQPSHVKWCSGCRGGAITCHSILNPNLHVYDNSSPTTRRRNSVQRSLFEAALPFLNTRHRRGFRGRKPASQSQSHRQWASQHVLWRLGCMKTNTTEWHLMV